MILQGGKLSRTCYFQIFGNFFGNFLRHALRRQVKSQLRLRNVDFGMSTVKMSTRSFGSYLNVESNRFILAPGVHPIKLF